MTSRSIQTELPHTVENFLNTHNFKYVSENINGEITEKCDKCGLLLFNRIKKFSSKNRILFFKCFFVALAKDNYWGEISVHYLGRLSCEEIMIKSIIE